MKTTIKILVAILFALSFTQSAQAYDFIVDGLKYTVLSFTEMTVEVNGIEVETMDSVTIPSTIQYNNRTLSVIKIGDHAFSDTNIKHIIIPNSIRLIENYAFSGTEIENISIPNSVIRIGFGAFRFCKKLRDVKLPEQIKISDYFFANCDFRSTEWLKKITYVGKYAFRYNKNLKNVIIPASIMELDGTAFDDCPITKIEFLKDTSKTTIDTLTFDMKNNDNTTSYYFFIIDSLYLYRNIQSSKIEFYNSSKSICIINPEYVEFGPDIKIINEQFYYYHNDNYSYRWANNPFGCTRIETIKFHSQTPPIWKNSEFTNKQKINAKIYVPKGAKETYQSDKFWGQFWNIEEYDDDAPTGITDSKKKDDPTIDIAENNKITIQGTSAGEKVYVYNINGSLIGSTICNDGITTIKVNLSKGNIAIIKIGNNKTFKTVMQ